MIDPVARSALTRASQTVSEANFSCNCNSQRSVTFPVYNRWAGFFPNRTIDACTPSPPPPTHLTALAPNATAPLADTHEHLRETYQKHTPAFNSLPERRFSALYLAYGAALVRQL